ncbi:thioredoxin family protein [Halobacteriales archaeon SW_6_65_46]|nr:MAG: thioredoxin family protein [Halobacteriales archaeon SW_6_65_46]
MVQTDSDSELRRGDTAPEFRLIGTDGARYALDSFGDNDALLVVFTCNHCPYAKAKFGALNALASRYDDCAVVGINPNDADAYPDDSYERMCELTDDGTVAYDAYLRDDDGSVADSYGAVCTPDPFLFRADNDAWRLAYHGRLDDALDPDDEPSGDPGFEMRRAIESVLAGEEVTLADRPSRGCSITWPS